ncbi:hypothetical protein ACET8B_02095 [Aeromonas caviae]|uniref:hypothetical protein n=1 Tax=Aeromonas caviae TaxID=648 RepID=UPI0038D05404
MGDDLKEYLQPGTKLKIAASCFSIYAYDALKSQLEQIEELEFIFTAPTFVEDLAVDKLKKEKREFHIPNESKERSFFGSEFEKQFNVQQQSV